MLGINTNLSSLIAQRSLNNSTLLLNQAIERMTTGYKINHAKDNAANYSIATNMTTKLGAYQVAENNTAMGLDMVTTASDTLNLISDKLARIRALAEQAANGTYGKQSLSAINREGSAIADEIYRLVNSAEYNGKKLFRETAGPDMSKLTVNSDGFMQEIKKRDTTAMTSLEAVNESSVLAKGTYSISSAEELAKLARMQNSGKITADCEFVLGDDIDLSGYANWTPIGWEDGVLDGTSKYFCGTFDGNGYVISNLTSIQNYSSASGLFGTIQNSHFKNLGLENIRLQGARSGSLAGQFADKNKSEIENCYVNNVNITNTNTTNKYIDAGGFIGSSQHITTETIINFTSCYANEVSYRGNIAFTGGFIGSVNTTNIKNCFVTNLELFSDDQAKYLFNMQGGFCGNADSNNIENCYVSGNMTMKRHEICDAQGGIANGSGNFKNCYFEGTLDGATNIGGIEGNCSSGIDIIMENCSVNAEIKNAYTRAGGISGWSDNGHSVFKNCHFNGKISGVNANVDIGAIVGGGLEDCVEVKDCTYNQTLNGILEPIGDGLGTASNITDCNIKTNLQIGINADENSQIEFGTFIELGNLRTVIISGLQNNTALETIDNILSNVSSIQTQLGSVENRLESVLEEISTQYQNLSSSRSTLKDADIADVSSQYVKQQILQQASATLLATANQAPSIALQLL